VSPVLQHPEELVRGDGPTEQIPLNLVALMLAKKAELGLVLDSLGDDVELEAVGHRPEGLS
jgi:hypothetical protein